MQFDFVYKVYQIYKQNYSDKNKLIAVSFGQDSISLLFFLFYIQQILNQPTYLLHCNHFYTKDNFFTLNEGFKISYLINGNLIIACPINIKKTETTQRLWRHRMFKRSIQLLNLNSIYLGHTKTDKIETIKYNFQTEFKTLLDFFNFIENYKSVNCIYNDQIIEIGSQ